VVNWLKERSANRAAIFKRLRGRADEEVVFYGLFFFPTTAACKIVVHINLADGPNTFVHKRKGEAMGLSRFSQIGFDHYGNASMLR
jgi:hypothetical protein